MAFKDWLLSEEIYPNNTATVFHRTKDISSIEKILYSGFQAGGGCMYGCGLYTTFDLKSQFRKEMNLYGNYIVKFKVTNLEKYLLTPITVAKYVLKNNYKISDQFKSLGWDRKPRPKSMDIETYGTGFEGYDELQEYSLYSSDLAHKIYEENRWIEKNIAGMVYYGRTDGYCLVKYSPVSNGLTFLGYTEATVGDSEKYSSLIANQGWRTLAKGGKVKHFFNRAERDIRVGDMVYRVSDPVHDRKLLQVLSIENNDETGEPVVHLKGLPEPYELSSLRKPVDGMVPYKYRLPRSDFEQELEDVIEKTNYSRLTSRLSLLLRKKQDLTEEYLIFLLKRYPQYANVTIKTISKHRTSLLTPKIMETINHSAYDHHELLKIIVGNINKDLVVQQDDGRSSRPKDKQSIIELILSSSKFLTLKQRKDVLFSLAEKIPNTWDAVIEEILVMCSFSSSMNFEINDFIETLGHLKEIGLIRIKDSVQARFILKAVLDKIVSNSPLSKTFTSTNKSPDKSSKEVIKQVMEVFGINDAKDILKKHIIPEPLWRNFSIDKGVE